MANRVENITGKKFSRLTILSYSHYDKERESTYWLCRCDCGIEKIVASKNLRSGESKSCGCYSKELLVKMATKHGAHKTPEYSSWENMKARCYNKNSRRYKNYGGRGIGVCDRWKNSFESFLEDMGEKPSSKHSIDRKEVNGNYTPDNCRWATPTEQARNMSTTVYLSYKGIVKSRKDWCDIFNINHETVRARIRNGKTFEQAFEIIDHASPNYQIQHRQLLAA